MEVPHSALLSDAKDLLTRFDSLSDVSPVDLDLHLLGDSWHLAPAGEFRCLVATISAEEMARIFDNYRYAIFRDNPRGPLGTVAVNKRIKQSLAEDVWRPKFHLLNNGLSAVCDTFSDPVDSPEGMVTTVRGFQIVNG